MRNSLLRFVVGLLLCFPPWLAASAASLCPDNFVAFADTTAPLSCACSAEAAKSGPVWGMDVYTGDSSLCRAALHAGVIGKLGGTVTVTPEPGRKAYAGVTRNGVSSSNYGEYGSSFRFAGEVAATAAPAASQAPVAASVSVCPDNFVAFADTTAPLSCVCSAEAAKSGPVWGMDVYTGDSGLCRAALHAGAIGKRGGAVIVNPEPGRKAYAGVTRNGVSSSNYGEYGSSFRFELPAGTRTQGLAPVQQPIAASLRERGEVDLYIRFRTGSSELDPATLPVLDELRSALSGAPELNLALIGHTDNVGTREYNHSLSFRRAEAVRFWLAQHSVSPSRIVVDGRGFDEPLADNATESGRAFNRRVQAKRMK